MGIIENKNYILEIHSNNGELDVILGHKEFILNKYSRDNLKLKGGWYYRNIRQNTDILIDAIDKYLINKINLIGASKSCSGCIILAKELTRKIPSLKLNLFMFSAYTTINKDVYIKRNILERAPGTLKSLWESKWYTPELIKKMEARRLIDRKNVQMYFFFPGLSKYGEKQLAYRVKGSNVTHLEIPVYMHNTLYPFWKKVEADGTIEVYEDTIKKMHIKDYTFYSKMQSYEKYNFHLYSCLENTEGFVKQLKNFIDIYSR